MTDAELTNKVRNILKGPQVKLPERGRITRNAYGFEVEICPLCEQQLRPKYRRMHFSHQHGYNTKEHQIKQIVSLFKRYSK